MANKPPRKKFPVPTNFSTPDNQVDDEDVMDEEVVDEDATEETVDEETPVEDEAVEEEVGATFNYPTMDEMEEETPDETPESKDEDISEGVQFVGSTSRKATPDAMVKVRVSVHKQFIIGGEQYDLYPNKIHYVPENVRQILRENDLLRPL